MDCKKALEEANGNTEEAIDILRKKGQKVANKRADKEARQGIVMAKCTGDKKFAAIIMLNCETDFVAKNEEFVATAQKILDLALTSRPRSQEELISLNLDGHPVSEHVTELIGKIGEKMNLAHYEFIEAPKVYSYNHQGNRLATILGLNKADASEQVGHELAMQVAAMNPVAIDKDDVSKELVEREIEIGKEQARNEGKPETMLEKIAMGKLNKFYQESTLLNQEFVRDTKISVRQYLQQHDKDLKVTAFKRLMLGV